ncbi:MAG: MATE family efflux transporter [Angelakisella sp.]
MSNSANVLTLGKTPEATILKLSWPAILEQIAFTLLNFADTAMVGVLGAAYTAAVGLTSPVLWLAGGIIGAVSVGFSVQVAQAVGAGDYDRASRTVGQSLLGSAALGILLLVAGLLATPFLPKLLGAQPDVAALAVQYFGVMTFSFFANSFEVNISSILRCVGNTKSPLIANSIAVVVNVFLNLLFIFPTRTVILFGNSVTLWGANMGVAGAALGSVLSIVIAVFLMAKPFFCSANEVRFHLRDVKRVDRQIMSRAIELGIPVALERITMSLGQLVYIRIISTLGTTALAAHHLAIQTESLSYMPSFGFSMAATTLVGQSIGADDRPGARNFGRIAANMTALLMTGAGVFIFFGGSLMLQLFTRDVTVIAIGAGLLRIVAFAQPPQAFANVYSGALRGAGDTRWPFYINLLGVWGVRVGLSLVLVTGLGWGLSGAWIAMLCDQVFRGYVCRRRFLNCMSDG